MLRRTILLLLGLAVGSWLLAATAVLYVERMHPAPPPPIPVSDDAPAKAVAEAWGLRPARGFFRLGYTDAIGAEIGDWEYGCLMRRGALDRREATFPLSIRYASNTEGGLQEVRLSVTRSDVGSDEHQWVLVAAAEPFRLDDFSVVYFRDVPVHAATRGFEVEEIARSGERFSMAHSIPIAETKWGRIYDRYAWWPIFRWLPDGD